MKWYKEPYFDSKTWLIANFEKLNITNDELVLILVADFANRNGIKISYDYLMKKLSCDIKKIDTLIASLVAKKYLLIKAEKNSIVFNIDGIFEFDPNQYEIAENKDIFDTLDIVFARPLTQNELKKASDLINEFSEAKFNDALRVAEAYKKVSIAYIEAVLRNEENKS